MGIDYMNKLSFKFLHNIAKYGYSGRNLVLWLIEGVRAAQDMTISTRLVILIKNIYTLWGRKRFLRPVTYF